MGLREIKTKSRRALHTAMRVPASFYASSDSTPVLVHVRVHSDEVMQGDLKGTNLNYAEREEITPKLVFDREEVTMPPRNSIIIISATEGYRVGQTEVPDGITVKAEVSRLSLPELADKTLPEDL